MSRWQYHVFKFTSKKWNIYIISKIWKFTYKKLKLCDDYKTYISHCHQLHLLYTGIISIWTLTCHFGMTQVYYTICLNNKSVVFHITFHQIQYTFRAQISPFTRQFPNKIFPLRRELQYYDDKGIKSREASETPQVILFHKPLFF
jgi:hypothetical protein